MFVKPKSVLIIILSSIIIGSVMGLTIFGFYAYLEWKERDIKRMYSAALYELNADLYAKYIGVGILSRIDTRGIFKGKPIVEGTVKNISNKKIYSLCLKVIFSDKNQRTVYVDTFYPVGFEFESFIDIDDITGKTENFLSEGNAVSFKHQLKNCPPKLLSYLRYKLKFAKLEYADPLELTYKIEGLDIR